MSKKILKIKINLQLFADSSGDKTEEATPKRRQEARKKGQVAKSQDLGQIATLLVGIIVLRYSNTFFLVNINNYVSKQLSNLTFKELTQEKILEIISEFTEMFFTTVFPILISVLAIGLIINYVQVGFIFTLESLKIDLNKINPLNGLKQLFSIKKIIELTKTIIKLILIGFYAYYEIKDKLEESLKAPFFSVENDFILMLNLCFSVIIKISVALLIVALIDYMYQKWEFEKGLKMTKQEVKDEFKQTEGDPQIKSKLRQMQKDLLNKKMIEKVPEATVIITNPTHISIALKYERGMGAPEVVAKGIDFMALRIREIAKEHNVPLIENKPLARAMYPIVEVNQEIPEEYYQAVAEILAVILE
ncbi:flagellar biosynthesis protein FlhB [Hypnocyclicus thermotrophus]|nr:flagellar biosynthesis protein FlhB [Hypnocyclicus thermotrophus]